MAHKKAAGSAKNLRNSKPKYRGIKVYGGQKATAGAIILRQKGDKYKCGNNTYKGNDFSIHAKTDGVVTFRRKNVTRYDGRKYTKTFVDVVSLEDYEKSVVTVKKEAKPVEKKEAKTTTKKTTKATTTKKATAKKTATKKTTTAKTAAKKTTTKKAATTKKTTAKKTTKEA